MEIPVYKEFFSSLLAHSKWRQNFISALGANERPAVLKWGTSIFIAGLLLRLTIVLAGPPPVHNTEPVNIALSLATKGTYADPYGPGVGPTAHCVPLHPLLVAGLFRTFGTGQRGRLALRIAASTAAALAAALLPALAVASGIGLGSGVVAGMAGALLPVSFWEQTSGVFDAPFTSVFLIALCVLVCRAWAAASFTRSEAAALGLTVGVGCLFNPVLIAVLLARSVLTIVRFRNRWPRVVAFIAVATACTFLVLAPWAIRNHRVLGSFIWTRSNFGLELQVSNNDLAGPEMERNVDAPDFLLMHPSKSAKERDKVRRMGEVSYQRAKMQQALAWITSHKRRFLLLSVERFRLFWVPGMERPWQTAFEAALSLLGFAGVAVLFWKRYPSAWIFGAALAAYPAIYYIVQGSHRYRFPIEDVLFLLAAVCFTSLSESLFFRRLRPAGPPPR